MIKLTLKVDIFVSFEMYVILTRTTPPTCGKHFYNILDFRIVMNKSWISLVFIIICWAHDRRLTILRSNFLQCLLNERRNSYKPSLRIRGQTNDSVCISMFKNLLIWKKMLGDCHMCFVIFWIHRAWMTFPELECKTACIGSEDRVTSVVRWTYNSWDFWKLLAHTRAGVHHTRAWSPWTAARHVDPKVMYQRFSLQSNSLYPHLYSHQDWSS